MRGADGRAQFLTEVSPVELEEITRRRRAAERGQPEPEPGPPDARRGPIGLAVSGAGIRSATFGLGVVQALAGGDFLTLVDYLAAPGMPADLAEQAAKGGENLAALRDLLGQPTDA